MGIAQKKLILIEHAINRIKETATNKSKTNSLLGFFLNQEENSLLQIFTCA